MNRCNDDSCDGAHCRRCGGHFLDFYNTDLKYCQSCEQEIEFERNPPICERCKEPNRDCAGRFCLACLDLESQAEVNAEQQQMREDHAESLNVISGEVD